MISAHIENKS